MVAATLLCVLTIGGLFLSQQFGGGMSLQAPAGEIARLEKSGVEQATVTEATILEEAAAEPAAEEEMVPPAEEVAEEEAAPAEAAPQKEIEIVEPEAEAEEPVASEVAEDAVQMEGEAPASEESLPADRGKEEESDASLETDIAPTPSPMPTMAAPVAAPPAEAVEEKALAEEEAPEPPEAGVAEQAPNLTPDDMIAPRPVEIQNQNLRVSPGLIQIEGVIEAAPGSILAATLQRNNEAFDDWADPPSLQTVVQPNGQFSFTIRAKAQRPDKNLFETESANYQIIITSMGVDEPVIAAVFFDTIDQPTATPLPTPILPPTTTPLPTTNTPTPPPPTEAPGPTDTPPATSTPRLTPTVVAGVTFMPTATPPVVTPETWSTPEAAPPSTLPVRLVTIIGVVLLGTLVIIGLIAWLITKRRK